MSGPAAGAPAQSQVEVLPPGAMQSKPHGGYSDPFVDDYGPGELQPDAGYHYGDYSGGSPACGDACGDSGCSGAECFVVAEVLHVEAGFSEALAFVDSQFINGTTSFEYIDRDFDFTSSYRFGGGYRLCECGEEVRFMYTRMRSDSHTGFTSEFVNNQPQFLIPFKPPQFDGGPVFIDAEVDAHTYDLEIAKTIALGCQPCECGDACGGQCGECCDPCAMPCPLWDFSWSLGLRYAEVDWYRSWRTFDTTPEQIGLALSTMDFQGVGPRLGVEGRRYFFDSGWLSAYAKTDISLLWGELEFDTVSQNNLDPNLPTETVVSRENRQVIPVTELEVGFSAQVTCKSRITGGYLVSAWHDLGFRDDFLVDPQLTFPIVYDDANILGFHGWFLRAEVAY
jgi:hypothetical protein